MNFCECKPTKYVLLMLLGCSVICFPTKADIVVSQLLDFGIIVIADNSAPASLAIDEFNIVTADPSFIIISPGQPAIYQITGLTPNTTFTVDVDILNVSMNPGVPSTEVFDLEIVRAGTTVLSDSVGEATLTFGGRITSSGSNGLNFADTTFTSNIRITVNN
jgi:hypothetical protein